MRSLFHHDHNKSENTFRYILPHPFTTDPVCLVAFALAATSVVATFC